MADNEATLLVRIKQVGGEVLDKFVITLGDIVNMAKSVGSALYGTIEAYKESEAASNKLSQAMVQQGIYSTELKKTYDDMAVAIQQKTTFADEEITAAQAIMQAQIGQVEVTKELMTATADLAIAQNMDLASAAQMVGKTIGGSTNALARQQIAVDANATSSEKLSQVLTGLNSKFGGQAEAAIKGLGVIDQLKVTFDDFNELIGKEFAPIVEVTARQLNSFFQTIQGGNTSFSFLKTVLVEIIGTIDMLYSNLTDVGEGLGAFFGTLAGAMEQALKGNFKNAIGIMKQGNADINQLHADNLAAYEAREAARQESKNAKDEENSQAEIAKIQESNSRKLQVQAEHDAAEFNIREAKRLEKETLDAEVALQDQIRYGESSTALLNAQLAVKNKEIEQEQDAVNKKKLIQEKAVLQSKLIESKSNDAKIAAQKDTMSTIATLATSSNKNLASIGKAAAITQVAMAAPVAIAKALAAFPPPFNFIAAGAVGAAMAVQTAQIAGIPLAEGGIVKATPGGTQATIGEGGRDEAVIPLENGQIPGSNQGQVIVNFNGPIMGDEGQAMEFARAIDKSLLKLRQSNQSVAFETDIF